MRIRTDNQKLVQVQAIIDPRKVFRHHFPKSKYFYCDMECVGRPSDIIQNLILMHKLIRIHGVFFLNTSNQPPEQTKEVCIVTQAIKLSNKQSLCSI